MEHVIPDDHAHGMFVLRLCFYGLTIVVLNLPQLYQKPDAQALLKALMRLRQQPRSWKKDDFSCTSSESSGTSTPSGHPRQITQYLTSIIGSSLQWIPNDELKEKVWEEASLRLTERSGRTGMSAINRSFEIRTNSLREPTACITIHEPTLTADNLGLKTWAASYLLAQRLSAMKWPQSFRDSSRNILELGAGTGLVGISAAIVFEASVCLTDLSGIEKNLRHNVASNSETIALHGGSAVVGILDWSKPATLNITSDTDTMTPTCFPVIMAADCAYASDQPRMLVNAIQQWLSKDEDARVVLEMPRRTSFEEEIQALQNNLLEIGLILVEEAEESGIDDWGNDTLDEQSLVHCWYSMWKWRPGMV